MTEADGDGGGFPGVTGGTVVAGHVELVERIGAGAMGEVWRAHHRRLATDVAVKLIRDDAREGAAQQRFELEARAAARLKSPHVVKVFDYGVGEVGAYIVMELLEGESLERRLVREGALAPQTVVEIVRQAARALDEAHRAGVVHRDIKPDNLWLARDGDRDFVKVVDFGIARASALLAPGTKLTHDGQPIGTPVYMSPEQILTPGETDAAADRWALAVCAYEMLTDRIPFDGETVAAVAMAVVKGGFAPPSQLVTLPAEVDDFFRRAFARDPAARFSTAKDLALALSAALDCPARATIEPPLRASVSTIQPTAARARALEAPTQRVVERSWSPREDTPGPLGFSRGLEAARPAAETPPRRMDRAPRPPADVAETLPSADFSSPSAPPSSPCRTSTSGLAVQSESQGAKGAVVRRGRLAWVAVALLALTGSLFVTSAVLRSPPPSASAAPILPAVQVDVPPVEGSAGVPVASKASAEPRASASPVGVPPAKSQREAPPPPAAPPSADPGTPPARFDGRRDYGF